MNNTTSIQDLREKYLTNCMSFAARIQFHTAVNSIKYKSIYDPASTRDEFELCLKVLEQVSLIGRILREEGYPVLMDDRPLDDNWNREMKRKLYFALNPTAKRILRQQGLRP